LEKKFQRSLTKQATKPTFSETSTIVEIDMSEITRAIRTASDLGAAIRERRKTLSMTQGDLAMQAGVSVATISAIENGKDTAQISIVLDLCRDLGLRLSVET
jgi:y4mF family transcriptional regulator